MAVLPTIRMVSPKGRSLIVNMQDRDQLLDEGWTMPGEAPPCEESSLELDAAKAREAQLVKLNVSDLRELAKALEVEAPTTLAKRDLIDAILAAEFKPPEEPAAEPQE